MKKTILVTGGTRGIGRAIVRRLAHDRLALAVAYRGDQRAAHETAEEIISVGGDIRLYQVDLADRQQVGALPTRVANDFGGLDGLVNNAGFTDDGAFLAMDASRYERVLKTNLFGTMRLTAAAMPYLLNGKEPAIVNLASLAGVVGKEGQVAYATTKGGLIGFTQWLGRKYGSKGVRINAIAPGFIRTNMVTELSPSMYEHIIDGTALQRMGEPEEVADAVAFLLAPGYLHATTLRFDGGFKR